MQEEFLAEIKAQNKDLKHLVLIVQKFKKRGLDQDKTTNLLTELILQYRFENSNEKEDLILDLLDFVSGWCSPKDRIWK